MTDTEAPRVGSLSTIGCFAGAAALGAVWVLVERQVSESLVDMRLFTHGR
ncbi:hypothetical protein JIX56_46745 [Streptomyces sp. CA-210063]|nr:hypothetical protein [Streptomyces sp. CA-210063]UUU36712.1 hypothetical protein JIX56_46745 [Streptomyces sp. CA-210063]